ncbi:unnamed protein product [Gemmataceae bacterium]|nr:unnamed protein product [Gemmataceae bacterium]VTU02614.1 unnamed protein product [Gemmataceae bacterium]
MIGNSMMFATENPPGSAMWDFKVSAKYVWAIKQ